MRTIILASASKWRKYILSTTRIPFTTEGGGTKKTWHSSSRNIVGLPIADSVEELKKFGV
jgi:predicted house-cleaning NTP pyrophosphatase (Maf/HAM1 superfamily)